MREPPRKLDVKTDRENPDCFNVRIFLNGEQQKSCTAYNAEEGWLTRYVMDEKDFPKIKGDIFEEEKVKGKITLEWIDLEKVIG